MKSLEALENWYNTESPRTKAYEYEQHYRLIKKDLEMLDLLKKHLTLAQLIEVGAEDQSGVLLILYDDDIEKIREWLKNGK